MTNSSKVKIKSESRIEKIRILREIKIQSVQENSYPDNSIKTAKYNM